jgi:phage-related protein
MSDQNELSGKIGLDTTDFKTAVAQLNRDIRVIESGFRASAAGMGDWAKSSTGLESRIKALNSEIEVQQKKASALQAEYERVAKEKGENSRAAQELQIKLNKENETLGKMQAELKSTQVNLAGMEKEEKSTKDKTLELDKSEDKAAGSTNKLGVALKNVGNLAKSAGSGIADLVGKVAKLAAGLALGLAAGAAAAAAGIAALVMKSGEWADQFATISGVTGISTTRLQELDYIGKKLDVDLSTMSGSMSKMIRSINSAKDGTGPAAVAYKELGVSIKDANGNFRDAEDIWKDAIVALGKVENETERDALAMTIFGKSAMELNPLITAGSDRLAEYADEAHRVGAVMSEEDVEALDAFKDSSDALHNTFKGITGTITARLAPAFSNILSKVNDFLASAQGKKIVEDLGNAFGVLGDALTAIVNNIGGEYPLWSIGTQLADLGKSNGVGILERIGGAIEGFAGTFERLKNGFKSGGISGLIKAILPEGGVGGMLSTLGGTIGKMVASLLTGFVSKPAQLLQIGLNIIQGISSGLLSAIPALLPVLLQLLSSLVSVITTNLPMLIQTGLQIILQLALGIMQAIPQLIPVVLQVINNFVQFLIQNLPLLINAAVMMLVALANGIAQALPVLIPTIIGIIPVIVNTLLQNLPILINAALNLIMALAQGIIAALPVLITAIPQIVTTIVNIITQNFPLIVSVALTLLITLINGIIVNLPLLGNAVVQIVTALVNGIAVLLPMILTAAENIITTLVNELSALIPTVLQVGKDIVTGIWNGIQSAWDQLLEDMKDIVAGLPDWVKKLLKIGSPSLVFADIGKNMAQGLGVGFQDSYRSIREQIGRAVQDLSTKANISVSGAVIGGGRQLQPAPAPIQIIIQGAPERELDMRRLARYVANEIQRSYT